ncbi:uncharacterized protein AB675_10351 [Cyphellophora attinorum]|uniref:Uncharacterized protein n=1 Tax=Cyphellophora attinorum TaxID=1664694 RepID=A0A0N1NWV8_9EURO|nr:uncharacterized protein AB675_10351 [Phialophora attinorum]KPI37425.1 hypothetical protein AB675_10351 [Phialophora attinorum]
MMSKISSISAFVATLTLTIAAPTPQSTFLSSGTTIGIKVQLAGFDTASVINAQLDQTTVVDRNTQIQQAEVNQAGPWCAGFSDTAASRVVRAVNGDGIFDQANPAVYGSVVTVQSYWCANTRPEVEAFVARAGGNGGDGNGNGNGNNNQQPPPPPVNAPAPPVNNGGNGDDGDNGNNGNNGNGATVNVEFNFGQAEFRQARLAANGGVVSADTIPILSRQVFGAVPQEGSCQFFANRRGTRAIQFPDTIRSYSCSS